MAMTVLAAVWLRMRANDEHHEQLADAHELTVATRTMIQSVSSDLEDVREELLARLEKKPRKKVAA
jgi:hypothetical protein